LTDGVIVILEERSEMKATRKLRGLFACLLVLTGLLAGVRLFNAVQIGAFADGSVSPVIQDFYIDNVYSGLATQFSFDCSDSYVLSVGILQTNITDSAANSTVSLSGTEAWANFTVTYPSGNSMISFDFWVNDSGNLWATTGNRTVNVYDYTNPDTLSYFNSLSQAITAVQGANDFNEVSPYLAYVLSQNQTSMQTMIDNYAAAQQWLNVLEWAAICNKLWCDSVPADVQTDVEYALGNYTMAGSLPNTDSGYGQNDFNVESQWGLYGYYFNNCSWIGSYQNNTKWNVTAAYNFFDTAINSSVATTNELPLQIYANGTVATYLNRYYDEDADVVECYVLFYSLLNVSNALNKAVCWWNYLVNTHWTPYLNYFGYTGPNSFYECEAGFFLKIISMLKYYYPSLGNWTYVLEDMDNRFLSEEWNSPQWIDESTALTSYAVVHADPGSTQRRLENTLGAWQALQGVYSYLDSVYQSNMVDMLSGNENLQPAWALLLSQYNPSEQQYGAGLYDAATGMFSESQPASSGYGAFADDYTATAQAEILLFMMGIVPGNTTVAFPLEELNYEYIQDVNPEMFQFNLANQTITIPVDEAGTMTFQYGESPVTCSFNQSGVWQVTFTGSWNMIVNVTYLSNLPSNTMYFSQIYTLPYNVTINAHCLTEGVDVNVSVALDGSPTGLTTPCTFTELIGAHTFTVSSTDPDGHFFINWTTGETTSTITVSAGGTFTAYYEEGPLSISVSPDTATLILLRSQSFNSTVSGGTSPYSYQWYLNNASVPGAANPTWTFTPKSAGPYTVYVNVMDSDGTQITSNTVCVQAFVRVVFLEGPYYTIGMQYWILGLSGEHPIRVVSEW
jgi:hypothetical protein